MRYLKVYEDFNRHHPECKIKPPEVTPHEAHEYVEKKEEQKEIEKEQQDHEESEPNNNTQIPNE